MKKNIIVFFGGKSTEHDISIITAVQTLNALSKEKYEIIPAYIDKNGLFFTGKKFFDLGTFLDFNPNQKGVSRFVIVNGEKKIALLKGTKTKKIINIDAALICCHGAGGEDGGLQGLLEMSNIPYSSSGVCSCAVCMNKQFMKDIFLSHNIPIVEHIKSTRLEFEQNKELLFKRVEKLGYPLITKPANSGSSIGISKCKNEKELEQALKLAFQFDGVAVIEKCIEDLMEVNCGVLKVGEQVVTSNLEEPKTKSDILTFDDKYLSSQQKNEKKVIMEKDIKLKKSQKELIKALAKQSFEVCNCDGVVRIDFMIDLKTQKIYVNEINSIPGSMANYLFAPELSFSELCDKLIESALEKNKEKNKNSFHFFSPAILSYLNSSTKQRHIK